MAIAFAIFTVIAPACFVLCAFALLFWPLTEADTRGEGRGGSRNVLLTMSRLSNAMSAVEVMIMTQLLLITELPTLTTSLVVVLPDEYGIKLCNILFDSFEQADGICFQEDGIFTAWWAFLPVCYILLLLARHYSAKLQSSRSSHMIYAMRAKHAPVSGSYVDDIWDSKSVIGHLSGEEEGFREPLLRPIKGESYLYVDR